MFYTCIHPLSFDILENNYLIKAVEDYVREQRQCYVIEIDDGCNNQHLYNNQFNSVDIERKPNISNVNDSALNGISYNNDLNTANDSNKFKNNEFDKRLAQLPLLPTNASINAFNHSQPQPLNFNFNQTAIPEPIPLHIYLNHQASISPKLFAASVWNLANSGRLIVLPESSAYNNERDQGELNYFKLFTFTYNQLLGPVTNILAPNNVDSYNTFIEQFCATMSPLLPSTMTTTTTAMNDQSNFYDSLFRK